MNLLETIQNKQNQFSKSEWKVADFISHHPEKIETFTISKVAEQSGTSTSAVLRFCQTIGFNGYKDFRFEMINDLHQQHHSFNENDLFAKLTNEYNKVINQMSQINNKSFDSLIDDILKQPHIFILGMYYSSLPAQALSMGLLDLGITCHVGNDYINSSHLINNIQDDDLFIHFSINGENIINNNHLSALVNNMPEKSYLITMNPSSKIAKHYRHVIVLPGQALLRQSIIDSQSIVVIFVELLLNLIHNRK